MFSICCLPLIHSKCESLPAFYQVLPSLKAYKKTQDDRKNISAYLKKKMMNDALLPEFRCSVSILLLGVTTKFQQQNKMSFCFLSEDIKCLHCLNCI